MKYYIFDVDRNVLLSKEVHRDLSTSHPIFLIDDKKKVLK